MKPMMLVFCVAGIVATAGVGAAGAAPKGAALCVRAHDPHCYSTLADAVAAAHDGDTVQVGPGTFSGGITIDKSIDLVGAGAAATTLSGGGPVLTIGVDGAATEPTVSIAGLTITGGVTHGDGVVAKGGGVNVPAAANQTLGATVTITNAVVTGNRVETTATTPIGPPCPTGRCPFAFAGGGGIANAGTLTITNSEVTNNLAAGTASDADGGGIWSGLGPLTVRNSVIARNRTVATTPNGRFAEGGGIFIWSGSLTVTNSRVNDNNASLTSALPVSAGGGVIDMNANSGGIHVGDDVPLIVENSAISGNSVSATDPAGEPVAFDAGMLVGDSPLSMHGTLISGNQVTETVATTKDVGPGGSALELDGGGTISATRIIGNTATSISPGGPAAVNGALAVLNFNDDPKLVTVQDTLISGNNASASSTSGSATVQGAGIFNNSLLALKNVIVSNNSGKASGPTGAAQGGGIWNGVELSGPPVELTLENTLVIRNSLTGAGGIIVQGGGLFTTEPVTRAHSFIALNAPDQCVGC